MKVVDGFNWYFNVFQLVYDFIGGHNRSDGFGNSYKG